MCHPEWWSKKLDRFQFLTIKISESTIHDSVPLPASLLEAIDGLEKLDTIFMAVSLLRVARWHHEDV